MTAATLVLDRGTVKTTIQSARRALDFLLGALESLDNSSPDEGHRAAIELHRFADGIATIADQAAAEAVMDAEVVDLAEARRARQARTRATEAAR